VRQVPRKDFGAHRRTASAQLSTSTVRVWHRAKAGDYQVRRLTTAVRLVPRCLARRS
jgi:hypothetical protein